MGMDVEKALAATPQSPLANEIVAMLAAVVSNASAPDSASRVLEKSRQDSLPPEQRAAAAALQAYGVQCAAEVFTPGLGRISVRFLDVRCMRASFTWLGNGPRRGFLHSIR